MRIGSYERYESNKILDEPKRKEIDIKNGYKYLAILEVDGVKKHEMKSKLYKEYTRKVRKVLKSKLNGLNTFTAIYSMAFAVIRYSTGVVHWRKNILIQLNRRTRKLLTMIGRSKEVKSLISMEDA